MPTSEPKAGIPVGDVDRCPEHGEPFPCSQPIWAHWIIEDGEDGWYVVRPMDQGRVGPFTEDEASAMLPTLRAAYPVDEDTELVLLLLSTGRLL